MSKLKVEQFVAKIDELTPTENNPRQISKQDFENLKKSMKEFPEMREIRKVVVDENNRILGGHMRIKALKELGESEVPVDKVYGLTEKQKRRFVVQDNIQNGEWDMDELANSWSDLPLDEWGIGVEWDTSEQEVVEDEAPEVDDIEPADSVEGGVYQLGRHRLMCGDSTDAGSVAILMDGQKADMVFTDPPYGVSYTGGQFYSGKPIKNRREQILNDKNLIYDISLQTILDYIDDGAFYVCYASLYSIEVLTQLRNIGLEQRAIIIWNKTNTGYGDLNSNYKNNYEPIFYGVKKGRRTNFVGDTTQTTVWSIDKPKHNDLHPTTKPTELCAKAIINSSNPEEVVVDLFGGSGSTLIACEQLGRTCYMMELDPKYCDVIRKRYWKFKTGSEEGWQKGTKQNA